MSAVAGCLFGYRQQDIFPFCYFLYSGFHDLHFGWIAFVVSGVYGVEDAFYLSQVGFRVIVAGGVEGIDHVIRILVFDEIVSSHVVGFFSLFAGGNATLQLPGATGHPEHGGISAAQAYCGFLGIIPAFPGRVCLYALDCGIAGDTVTATDLDGFAGVRLAGVHEIGISLGPDPAVHCAHGCPQDQAKVIDAHLLGHNGIIRLDHIIVRILREFHVQTVAGFARFAMADAIGKDDKIFSGVEGLAGFEEMAGEELVDKIMAVAGRAVHDIYSIDDLAALIFDGMAKGRIVQFEYRERCLSALEREIFNLVVHFGGVGQVEGGGCGSLSLHGGSGEEATEGQQEGKAEELFHAS